jgi:hypothetical protein
MAETLIPVIFIIVTIAFVAIAAYAIKLNDSFDILNNSQKSMHTILRETQTESRSNSDAIMVTRDKLADAIKKLDNLGNFQKYFDIETSTIKGISLTYTSFSKARKQCDTLIKYGHLNKFEHLREEVIVPNTSHACLWL